MRETLSPTTWEQFTEQWHPDDLILSSRKDIRDIIQQQLLQLHKVKYPHLPIPLLYRPKDTRNQNKPITVPGTQQKQILVLNDIVKVHPAQMVSLPPDWTLGYVMTIHSTQGMTVTSRLWILDNHLSWSNLTYLAVSRVEHFYQLKRVTIPSPTSGARGVPEETKKILYKLQNYESQDKKKQRHFNLTLNDIIDLKKFQNNKCYFCNIDLLWIFNPRDLQQWTADRLDNNLGHERDNIVLSCLHCNKNRGYTLA